MRSLAGIIEMNNRWANKELAGRKKTAYAPVELANTELTRREIKRLIAILLRYLNNGQAISLCNYISIVDGRIHINDYSYSVDTLPEEYYPVILKHIVKAYESRR